MSFKSSFWPLALLSVSIAAITFYTLSEKALSQEARPTASSLSAAPTIFPIAEQAETILRQSFEHKVAYSVDPSTRLILIPHHLVAGREIASLLSSIPAPKRVLLLSPDHFSIGDQPLATTRGVFTWQDKSIVANNQLTNQLIASLPKILQVQDKVFVREHGVRGLIPFLTQAWPNAEVNAVTVRVDSSVAVIDQLNLAIQQALSNDPDLLVAVTIDFSHELPAYVADLHDAYALNHLLARDDSATSNVEIDSPPLYRLLIFLSEALGQTFQVDAHTNSLRIMNALSQTSGTSHFIMSTKPGAAIAAPSTFTLVLDRARGISSTEERMYRGYDEVKTVTIPFPVAFIKEQTNDQTIWHPIPLTLKEDKTWRAVSDAERMKIPEKQLNTWITWAKLHL